MYYSNTSWAYLERAHACLAESDPRYLMYAAFEFRGFLESRQHQYLLAQEEYRRKLPKHWKTGEQGKELDQVFKNNCIQCIELVFEDGYKVLARYVPVSKALRASVEQLNTYRHSLKKPLGELELAELRNRLAATLPLAEECLSGNMLSPVFKPKKGGLARFEVLSELSAKESAEMKERLQKGTNVVATVRYEEPLSLQ